MSFSQEFKVSSSRGHALRPSKNLTELKQAIHLPHISSFDLFEAITEETIPAANMEKLTNERECKFIVKNLENI